MAHGSNVQYGIATVEHGCSAYRITTAEAHGCEYNMEGRDAFELGDDRGDSTEILGSAGLCVGGSYHNMVVQAADEEAEGQCL